MNVTAYYLDATGAGYDSIRKHVARDHERGVSTMIHYHLQGEPCNERCKLMEAE